MNLGLWPNTSLHHSAWNVLSTTLLRWNLALCWQHSQVEMAQFLFPSPSTKHAFPPVHQSWETSKSSWLHLLPYLSLPPTSSSSLLLPLQELPNPVDFITEIPLTLFPLSPFSLPQLKPWLYLSLELHILTSYLASRHPTSGPSYIFLPVHFPLSTYCIPGRGWREWGTGNRDGYTVSDFMTHI